MRYFRKFNPLKFVPANNCSRIYGLRVMGKDSLVPRPLPDVTYRKIGGVAWEQGYRYL